MSSIGENPFEKGFPSIIDINFFISSEYMMLDVSIHIFI